MKTKFLIIIFSTLIISRLNAQYLYIIKDKKEIPIGYRTYIGLTTKSDTIKYNDKKDYSFFVERFTQDSLVLIRPLEFSDTTIARYDGWSENISSDSLVYMARENFKQPTIFIKRIKKYECKNFAYKDITTLSYPNYQVQPIGCEICFVLPPLLAYYLIDTHNKRKPRLRNMNEWHFEIKQILKTKD